MDLQNYIDYLDNNRNPEHIHREQLFFCCCCWNNTTTFTNVSYFGHGLSMCTHTMHTFIVNFCCDKRTPFFSNSFVSYCIKLAAFTRNLPLKFQGASPSAPVLLVTFMLHDFKNAQPARRKNKKNPPFLLHSVKFFLKIIRRAVLMLRGSTLFFTSCALDARGSRQRWGAH